MNRYYVVQTQPQKERTAVFDLQNQGFETFYPVIRHLPKFKNNRLIYPKDSSLFPKYLFVSMDITLDPWRCVNGTRGVSRLMCMNDETPSPVPMMVMQRLLDAGELVHEEKAILPFNLGDSVEFTDGPMAGRQGLVQACSADRVSLLLSLLGGQVVVQSEPQFLKYVARV